ncbi:MAG: hypothetical protein RLZZ436_177 [Planctomycetota bacterium]
MSGRAEAPGCDSGTLVPTPARCVSSALPGHFTRGLPPCGIGFLARRSVGRAKLLLSRIPAPSVSSIPAAPQKRWQPLTARTSVQRLGWSLALGWRNGANSANSRVSLRRNGYPAFSLLKISNHDLSSLKPKTPLNSQITTVSPSQPRPPKDFTRLFTEFQRTPMPLGGSLRYALAPWCAPPACGVSSALAGHFTRGLPPCGSFVAATRG